MSLKAMAPSYPSRLLQQVPKVQPRSSAERDNNVLLHSALKAASTDMAHRLLDYASLDKVDCEASCILIALANHEPLISRSDNKLSETKQEEQEEEEAVVVVKEEEKKVLEQTTEPKSNNTVIQTNHKRSQSKNDPIMLLMAAAEVVNRQSNSEGRKRRSISSTTSSTTSSYSAVMQPSSKRMRTNPPAHKPDTWRKNSSRFQPSSTKVSNSNSFSRQYHSMKQNPKIKQNALHTYITYMIYNDLANGGGLEKKQNESTTNSYGYQQKQLPAKTNEYHQRSYAGDSPAYTNSMRSTNVNNSQLTTHTPPPSIDSGKASTLSSSWYPPNHSPLPSSRSPLKPPSFHDDRSIMSRPLTAFLWDNKEDNNNTKRTTASPQKDMMILPPLASKGASSSNNSFDRLPPV